MRVSLLTLSLSCLVGYVYSNCLPNAAEFYDLTALRTSAGGNNENDRMIGGILAQEGEFPYLAGFIRDSTGRICGGSLISPNIIVTAAHCVYGKAQSSVCDFQVVLNSTLLSGGPNVLIKTVRAFVIHPDFNATTKDNDIALLALNTPATGITTINLPTAGTTETYAGKTATIAGFGITAAGSDFSSNNMRKEDVTIWTNADCYAKFNTIKANHICAYATGKDTCQGDYGGPMVVDGTLVGVISYGRGCRTNPILPNVLTRVSKFVNWINTTSATI